MNLTRTAFGIWGGGRYMHFGETLPLDRFQSLIRHAYDRGIRTFLTADVYGNGEADTVLGAALADLPRESYCLVGAVGHDFYTGQREGSKGFPRFTDPRLRGPDGYADYLKMATEKSLARCGAAKFDLLLLHNPDSIGYTSDAVWNGLAALKNAGLTARLGLAPGPANGFTLDIIQCFERFSPLIDWAMIILNPLEPWPGELCLAAAAQHDVQLLTRVVDYGGLFHDDVKPGHQFAPRDHRTFRPAGWVEAGNQRLEPLRAIAARHGLTLLQLACLWNLAHRGVACVVPTLIQEIGGKSIEAKADELAALPVLDLSPGEVAEIRALGDNTGSMALKGASPAHEGETLPDRWSITPELTATAQRWHLDPARDLAMTH